MVQRGNAKARRLGWLMLASLLAAFLLGGCGGGGGGLPVVTNTRTVTGTVINYSTGASIVGATVAIGSITGTTDSDGAFTLNKVERVSQTLSVTATGYQTYSGTVSATQDTVPVKMLPNGVNVTDYPPDPAY